ncbi:MAG: hypothetical protein HUU01_16605 [Saprospiraceae bacterium]|nr:hypothetical protein [Saprospiraceae bacterium]
MLNKSVIGAIAGWVFGIAFMAIGLINTFWGNDSLFGVFIVLLSFVFLPPVHAIVKNKIGFSIPVIAKIALGIFIVWASLGVGELFDKIDLMVKDLL